MLKAHVWGNVFVPSVPAPDTNKNCCRQNTTFYTRECALLSHCTSNIFLLRQVSPSYSKPYAHPLAMREEEKHYSAAARRLLKLWLPWISPPTFCAPRGSKIPLRSGGSFRE